MLSTRRFRGSSARRATVEDVDFQSPLATRPRAEVRHGPVQPGQPKHAANHPGALSERPLEQHLDREAKLERRIQGHRRALRTTFRRCIPSHLLVQPDQQRFPIERGGVVG